VSSVVKPLLRSLGVGAFYVHIFIGAFAFPVALMAALVPTDDAFRLTHLDDDFDPIAPLPPRPKFRRYGINQLGQLYEYGDTPATPKRILDSSSGLPFQGILDLALRERAGERRKLYLDTTLATRHPYVIAILALPCFNSSPDRCSWPIRSLLGALTEAYKTLDLHTMAGTISSRRGTKPNSQGFVANFVDLWIEGDPLPLLAPAIDPDRHSLETTVNRLRRAMQFEHQPQ